jgi:WD40 repeat protein
MRFVLASLVTLGLVAPLHAAEGPSFARQVRPFLARYCLECHNADKTKGELNLETFKTLSMGGKNGPAVVPGKPDESRLVTLVEKKQKPVMPPEKAKQPTAAESAVLRTWVAAGAVDDTGNIKVTLPPIKARAGVPAPVAALAYHPDGKRLAAGLYGEVAIIDVANGEVLGKLGGQTETVSALVFSKDGKTLAVSSGAPGVSGEVRIYTVPSAGMPNEKPTHLLAGHKDVLYTLAFSPDNKTLTSAGYDRLIRVWDVADGKEIRTLKDHSDTVYGLAFNHDGTLLASASADRAVKVWEVTTGRRLYTLSESTDWLYALTWSPDGRYLAAGGVDQSIRVWQVNAESGKIAQSAYAHEGPVLRLVYSSDGKTLYSMGEDGVVKSWDAATLRERLVYPKQAAAPLSLAVQGKHLAIGRHDGALIVLDEANGKQESQPLPAKPKPPKLNKITPDAGTRGNAVRVRLEGQSVDGVTDVIANVPGVTIKLRDGKTATALEADVMLPANAATGAYTLTAKSAAGMATMPFHVDAFAAKDEVEPNDSPGTGMKVSLPVSLVGSLGKAGDVDYFRFEAKAGQQVGVQILVPDRGKLEPVLQLLDASGKVVAEGADVLGYTCPEAGAYVLGVRDRDFRGGGLSYRLHVGDLPVVTSLFPLGMERGREAELVPADTPQRPRRATDPIQIRVDGVNLGELKSTRIKTGDAAPGARIPIAIDTPRGPALGVPSLLVGEFPEISTGISGFELPLSVPGTANGRITHAGVADTCAFPAKKGQRLIVEVNARRLGTPLDSFIEIVDDKGRPVPRATLRCTARTFTVFRDHDSAGSGIRIETWSDFAMNDLVLIGEELLKIRQLPKNPDDDCQFFAVEGKRVGQLDTTPTHHSMGVPMYKVAVHPAGSTFPPNGLPVVTLNYRNDDGGPGYGKDSCLFFDPPADGTYRVRIGDARGQAGPTYAYRLTVRPPRPDFSIRFNPTAPSVWKGGAVPISVTATRIDGFDGRIDLALENLPPGFSAPPTHIGRDDTTTAFSLWADADAKATTTGSAPKLVARATIDGKSVVREATGQLPKTAEPGDLVTTTGQSEITVKPGSEVRLQVKVERRNGFTGRVPLDVRGLPHGVRVLDIGLNGILIIPGETTRTIVIYCEPSVQELEHPFVVLSRREGMNTEHAAKSVLLKVRK